MQTYYIWTIGCQMNKYESERIAGHLESQGYLPAADASEADLIILNGCVVRQSAEDRVTNKLHSIKALQKKHPEMIIAVTGCFVQPDSDILAKQFPFVNHFFPAGEFPAWLGEYHPEKVKPSNTGVTAYLPIMQGCNNFCSYCIVPYRRGREKSRSADEILQEAEKLVAAGVKEITLLGQNVNSYGQDLPGKPELADLLKVINGLQGLYRVRFLTNHPKDMQTRLMEAMRDLDKVCEQINLPCQAGDDDILKMMRRGYSADQYRRLIEQIRRVVPQVSLSTDVIVGFPGENREYFENTVKLLKEIRFDMVHVAAYSPRSGTLAARSMQDDVPAVEKKERLSCIEQMQAEIVGEINAGLYGQIVEILVEGREKGRWFGRTRSDKVVFFEDPGDNLAKLVRLKVTRSSPWSLTGILV